MGKRRRRARRRPVDTGASRGVRSWVGPRGGSGGSGAPGAASGFRADNGGPNLVPGSHKSLDPVDQEAERVMVSMPRGSLLAWDGACWHGGGASIGDTERCGLNINYNVGWLRQQENQFVSIPQDVIPTLSERMQRLLGYQHHGILGLSGGQDPLEVLRGRAQGAGQDARL